MSTASLAAELQQVAPRATRSLLQAAQRRCYPDFGGPAAQRTCGYAAIQPSHAANSTSLTFAGG